MAAGVLGVVAIVGVAAGHPAAMLPLLLGVGFCLYFFRDPERRPPPDDHLVVSPADGRVLEVREEREEQFLHQPATRVSIFMSPLDVHVNRSPVAGTIELVRHTAGRFRAAFADKASLDNERNAVLLTTPGGRFLVVQIAGALARRIICHRQPGERPSALSGGLLDREQCAAREREACREDVADQEGHTPNGGKRRRPTPRRIPRERSRGEDDERHRR